MPVDLGTNGQPEDRALGWKRLRDSRTDELIGLCRGVLADGILVVEEARYTLDWLNRNLPARNTFLGKRLHEVLDRILCDDHLDADEEHELIGVLAQIIGGLPEDGTDASCSTTLPLDDPPPEVLFNDRGFCFTGKFRFGTRGECEQAVRDLGGTVHPSPRRDTAYLVIGDVGSRDWAHSSMGRKIEHAVEMREKHGSITIISESHWSLHLQGAEATK